MYDSRLGRGSASVNSSVIQPRKPAHHADDIGEDDEVTPACPSAGPACHEWESTTSWCGRPLSLREWAKGHILTNRRFKQCGKLMQVFACDMFSVSEEKSLRFISSPECQGRIAAFRDLEEATGTEEPGRIFLPGACARMRERDCRLYSALPSSKSAPGGRHVGEGIPACHRCVR